MTRYNPVDPAQSLVNKKGCVQTLEQVLADSGIDPEHHLGSTHTVLAYGSNPSPEQIRRKYQNYGDDVVILLVRGRLKDFDTVYAPFFAHYGSLPAVLQYSPGTILTTFVSVLSDAHLDLLHQTEGVGSVYCYGRLDNIDLRLDGGHQLNSTHAYLSLLGHLMVGGKNVALEAIPANNREYSAKSQEEILRWTQTFLGDFQAVDQFIVENIHDKGKRSERSRRLQESTNEFLYSDWERVL